MKFVGAENCSVNWHRNWVYEWLMASMIAFMMTSSSWAIVVNCMQCPKKHKPLSVRWLSTCGGKFPPTACVAHNRVSQKGHFGRCSDKISKCLHFCMMPWRLIYPIHREISSNTAPSALQLRSTLQLYYVRTYVVRTYERTYLHRWQRAFTIMGKTRMPLLRTHACIYTMHSQCKTDKCVRLHNWFIGRIWVQRVCVSVSVSKLNLLGLDERILHCRYHHRPILYSVLRAHFHLQPCGAIPRNININIDHGRWLQLATKTTWNTVEF